MGRVWRAAWVVGLLAVTLIADVNSKIKKVEFIVDRRNNRRVGYVVTKVRSVDNRRKDDVLITEVPESTGTNEHSDPSDHDSKKRDSRLIEHGDASAASVEGKDEPAKKESTKKIDRNTLSEDDHAEMVELEEAPQDTQAVETSYAGEISSPHEDNVGLENYHHVVHHDSPSQHQQPQHQYHHPQHHHEPEHHHDPYEKTVTIVKKVPEPYPVEKTIHVPIYKNVPYPVEIPVPEPFPIEKKIPYPVKVIVKVPVKIPKPIAVIHESYYPVHVPVDRMVPHKVYVPEPYPVEQKVFYEVKVPVPEPFPVERKIPVPVKYPVHILQPFPVDKIVPYPVKVEEDRPIPVPILKPYPVPVTRHVPFPVEKHIPVPVKVKVDNPIPVPYDKPVPVPVKVPEEVPYPVEKEVHYPVHVQKKGDDDGSLYTEAPGTTTSQEPAPIHEDPAERKSNHSHEYDNNSSASEDQN